MHHLPSLLFGALIGLGAFAPARAQQPAPNQTEVNPQLQTKITWPAAFPVARAYVDQLERDKALPAARIAAVNKNLDAAEKATGAARKQALDLLASQLAGDAAKSGDAGKVRMLQDVVKQLAK